MSTLCSSYRYYACPLMPSASRYWYASWLLLDSTGVNLPRSSHLIVVTLSSSKPLFFNGLKPTVSLDVPDEAACTDGYDDGRISPTRCAVINAGLNGRESPHQAC